MARKTTHDQNYWLFSYKYTGLVRKILLNVEYIPLLSYEKGTFYITFQTGDASTCWFLCVKGVVLPSICRIDLSNCSALDQLVKLVRNYYLILLSRRKRNAAMSEIENQLECALDSWRTWDLSLLQKINLACTTFEWDDISIRIYWICGFDRNGLNTENMFKFKNLL